MKIERRDVGEIAGLLILVALLTAVVAPVKRSDAQSYSPAVAVEPTAAANIHVGSADYPIRLTLDNMRWPNEVRLSVSDPSVLSTGPDCGYDLRESQYSWWPRDGDLKAPATEAMYDVTLSPTPPGLLVDYRLKVCGYGSVVVTVEAFGASPVPIAADSMLLTVYTDASGSEPDRTMHGIGNKQLYATMVHLRRPKPRVPGGTTPGQAELAGVVYGGANGVIDLVLEATGDVSSVVPTMQLIGYTRDGDTARTLVVPQAYVRGGQASQFPVRDIGNGSDAFYVGITLDAMHLLPSVERSDEFNWKVASLEYDWTHHLGYTILQAEPHLRDVTSMAGKLRLPTSMLLLPDWPGFELQSIAARPGTSSLQIHLAEGVEVCRNTGGSGPRGPVVDLEELTVTPGHIYGKVEVKCFREPIPVQASDFPMVLYVDSSGQLASGVPARRVNLNALGYLHDTDLTGTLVVRVERTDGSAQPIVVSKPFNRAAVLGTPNQLQLDADFDIPVVPNVDVMVPSGATQVVSPRHEYEVELTVEINYDLSVPYKTSPGYSTLIPVGWRLPAKTTVIKRVPASTTKRIVACCSGTPQLGQFTTPARWELLGSPTATAAQRMPAKRAFTQEATSVFTLEVEHRPPGAGTSEYTSVVSYHRPVNAPPAPIPSALQAPQLPSGNPPPLPPANNVLPGTGSVVPSVSMSLPATWPNRGSTKADRALVPVNARGLDPDEVYALKTELTSADSAASLDPTCAQPSSADVASIQGQLSFSTIVEVFSCANGTFDLTVIIEDSSDSVVASSLGSMTAEVTAETLEVKPADASVWLKAGGMLKVTGLGLRQHISPYSLKLTAPSSGEISFAPCGPSETSSTNMASVANSVSYEIRYYGCKKGTATVNVELSGAGTLVASASIDLTVTDLADVTTCPNKITNTFTIQTSAVTVEQGELERDGCYAESLLPRVGRRYADAYTFDLSGRQTKLDTEIVVEPEQGEALDPAVYLLNGDTTTIDGSTTLGYNDDDSSETRNARIALTLNPAVYTILVTSATNEEAGRFKLTAQFTSVCPPKVLGIPANVGDSPIAMSGEVPASLGNDGCSWEDPASPGTTHAAEIWRFTLPASLEGTTDVALLLTAATTGDLKTIAYLQSDEGDTLYNGDDPVELESGVATSWALHSGTTYRLAVIVDPAASILPSSTRNYSLSSWRP